MRQMFRPHSPVRGAMAGFIVALGAPVGWVVLHFLEVELGVVQVVHGPFRVALDTAEIMYITGGTILAFTLFGWALGRREANLALANQRLAEQAITDDLTGLLNRRELLRRFAIEMSRAQRQRAPLSVLFVDIDSFKNLNDTYGHAAGDEVLAHLGALFTRDARAMDVVGRYGGEEFVLILPDTDEEEAYLMSERLRTVIADNVIRGPERTHTVTVSIGLAVWSPERGAAETEEALLRDADRALYAAKAQGRNCTVRASTVEALREPRDKKEGARQTMESGLGLP